MDNGKRYQVFISSTFTDLVDERQAVLKAVLELDHMPAGMELFPALDDNAWQLIKDVIDASDYYVLIIGGRYGSLDQAGIGYTEKEYDYTVSTKKPVIPLLHKNPDNLPRGKTEISEGAWRRLREFRQKVESQHTCVYWNSADDLKAKVIVGLTATIKRHPAIGWVRASQVPSGASLADVLRLRDRVTELENELACVRVSAPPGTEDLLQGDDPFDVRVEIDVMTDGKRWADETYLTSIAPTWDELFAAVAPALISELSDSDLRDFVIQYLLRIARAELKGAEGLENKTIMDIRFSNDDIDTCIVQFRALGLIRESDRRRSLKDTATYWTLTPHGDHLLVQLRALHRTQKAQRSTKKHLELTTRAEVKADGD